MPSIGSNHDKKNIWNFELILNQLIWIILKSHSLNFALWNSLKNNISLHYTDLKCLLVQYGFPSRCHFLLVMMTKLHVKLQMRDSQYMQKKAGWSCLWLYYCQDLNRVTERIVVRTGLPAAPQPRRDWEPGHGAATPCAEWSLFTQLRGHYQWTDIPFPSSCSVTGLWNSHSCREGGS